MKKIGPFYILVLSLILAISVGAFAAEFSGGSPIFQEQEALTQIESKGENTAPAPNFSETNEQAHFADESNKEQTNSADEANNEQTATNNSSSPLPYTEKNATSFSADDQALGDFFKPANFSKLMAVVQEKDMKPIETNKRISDSLKKRGSSQFYIFNIDQRGYIELDFVHNNASTPGGVPYWDIYLYEAYKSEGSGGDRQYRELSVLRAALDSKPALSNPVGVYPGTYVVMVTNTTAFSSSAYGLTAGFTPANDYEAEFNDSIYRYNEIYSGRPIKGSSSRLSVGKDIDFFMFEMKNQGHAKLFFEHDDFKLPSIGWRINMYDSKGNLLYAGRSAFSDKLIESGVIGLRKGLYFIEVTSHEYHPAPYGLTITATANNNYESEPNDSFESANSLKNNVAIHGSLSLRSSPLERDFYKISMPSRGYLQLFFEHDDLIRDLEGWNIYIYNSNKSLLYSDVSAWNTSLVSSPKIGLPAGDYYISIDAENRHHNPATYKLRAEYVLTNDWESENNNAHTRANEIKLGMPIHGSLVNVDLSYDLDYFYFELEKETSLYFRFEHKNLHANHEGWVISLSNSSLMEIKSLVSKWNETSVSSSNIKLPAGRYYIKVDIDSGMYFNSEEYKLTLIESSLS